MIPAPVARCSSRRCSRCSTRPRTSPHREERMSDHIPGRARWPIRSRTSRMSTRFPARSGRGTLCSCRTRCRSHGDGAVLRRARVPLQAAACGRGGLVERQSPFDVHDAEEVVFDCVFSEARATGGRRARAHPGGTPSSSSWTTSWAGPHMGCGPSRGCAGIRSSWTPRRRSRRLPPGSSRSPTRLDLHGR